MSRCTRYARRETSVVAHAQFRLQSSTTAAYRERGVGSFSGSSCQFWHERFGVLSKASWPTCQNWQEDPEKLPTPRSRYAAVVDDWRRNCACATTDVSRRA